MAFQGATEIISITTLVAGKFARTRARRADYSETRKKISAIQRLYCSSQTNNQTSLIHFWSFSAAYPPPDSTSRDGIGHQLWRNVVGTVEEISVFIEVIARFHSTINLLVFNSDFSGSDFRLTLGPSMYSAHQHKIFPPILNTSYSGPNGQQCSVKGSSSATRLACSCGLLSIALFYRQAPRHITSNPAL